MQFEQKKKRNFWINSFLGLIPDSIIGIASAILTESSIFGFLITVIGLQCIYFLIWLKNTIWQWTFYKFRGKELMVEHLSDWLKVHQFPMPQEYEESIEGYLLSLVENEGLEPEIRILAASEIGSLKYPLYNMRVQESLRLTMAWEEALSNYKKFLENRGSESVKKSV